MLRASFLIVLTLFIIFIAPATYIERGTLEIYIINIKLKINALQLLYFTKCESLI